MNQNDCQKLRLVIWSFRSRFKQCEESTQHQNSPMIPIGKSEKQQANKNPKFSEKGNFCWWFNLAFFLIILIMQLHRTLERRGVTTSFLILTCALTLQTCNFEFAAFFCCCEKNVNTTLRHAIAPAHTIHRGGNNASITGICQPICMRLLLVFAHLSYDSPCLLCFVG